MESSDALNVAEDTFQMADLVTKVGGADADMIALWEQKRQQLLMIQSYLEQM